MVRRLSAEVDLPRYAHAGDAGLDLVARDSVTLVQDGGRAAIPTGLCVAIDPGFVGLIMPRSGLALDHGVTVLNAPGVVDSSFRGEIVVILINLDGSDAYTVHRGDRIAQLLVSPVVVQDVVEVEKLPMSERGESGLGATGR